MGQRKSSHKIETKAKNNVRRIIDSGNFLFRDITEQDYGIDAVIEYFDGEDITGKLILLQLKRTGNEIVPLKNEPVISCSISTSSAMYAFQNNIPVILIFASLKSENIFYYIFLQDIPFDRELLRNQDSVTVHIPVENAISNNVNHLAELTNTYYLD